MTALSMGLHWVGPSTMHLSEEGRIKTVQFHQEYEIFSKRPLTTNIVVFLAETLGLKYQLSFYLLQFVLFFFTGPAFYYFLRKLSFRHAHAIAGMILFLSCMPVMMAHFEPVHTWDDFWLYLFVPLSLGLTLGGQLIPAAVAMTVALISRETTLLFLPYMFLAAYLNEPRSKLSRAVFVSALSLIFALVIRISLYGIETATPNDDLNFNFISSIRTSDTIFSLLVSLGFLWAIGIWEIFRSWDKTLLLKNAVKVGAVITVLGFLSATVLYGHARESRLFVPPAIFLIPLTLWYVESNLRRVKEFMTGKIVLNTFIGILLFVFSVLLVMFLFPAFEYRTWPDANRLYLAVHVWVVIVFLIFEMWLRREKRKGLRP